MVGMLHMLVGSVGSNPCATMKFLDDFGQVIVFQTNVYNQSRYSPVRSLEKRENINISN